MFSRGFYITLLVDIRHELAKNCVVLHDHCISLKSMERTILELAIGIARLTNWRTTSLGILKFAQDYM